MKQAARSILVATIVAGALSLDVRAVCLPAGCVAGPLDPKPQESSLEKAVGEYRDFLPQPGFLPPLTAADVARFVALNSLGWKKLGEGDPGTAERAFKAQIAIYPGNYEPYIGLAFVDASRGEEKQAIADARDAVLRGFTDLHRLRRAEGWRHLRNKAGFFELEVFLPSLVDARDAWAGWSDFKVPPERAPDALAPVLDLREDVVARIDRMAPALGPHLTPLWKKTIDRATAARIEAYLVKHPEAPDFERAAAALLSLYTGGPACRWEVLPTEAAQRVGAVANALLDKFPQSPLVPSALFCRALSQNARRDTHGALSAETGDAILADLERALAPSSRAAFAPSAVAGLVRTEAELGRMDRASARYAELAARTAKDPEIWAQARSQLGVLAVRAGGVPDVALTALDGTEVAGSTLRGQVVVMNFWGTWCRSCVAEFPPLRKLAARGGDVTVVNVSLDRSDELPSEELRAWVEREKVPGRPFRDGMGWDGPVVQAFGVTEIPLTLVVAADGTVVSVNPTAKQLPSAVDEALAAKARSTSR